MDLELGAAERQRLLEIRILRKLDLHVLPPLVFLWLANFIDRSNVGNARVAGLETALHLHGTQFNSALAVFFASYIVSEIPSNLILKKMKPNRWLPFIVTAWGLVTMLSGFVQNYGGLLAVRIVLGFTEGGLLPGIVLYLSTMYTRHELQWRIGVFYSAASLAGAFGGLLAAAIIKMNGKGHEAGWRWIFILEGIATIVIGLIASLILPEGLATAKFFTEEERVFALNRFHADGAMATIQVSGSKDFKEDNEKKADVEYAEGSTSPKDPKPYGDEQFEWGEVVRGVLDIQTWLTALAYMSLLTSLYSISLFLPTIIAGLGNKGVRIQLLSVPPFVPAAFLTFVVAFFSDRYQSRMTFALVLLIPSIVGYIVAITAETNRTRYAAVFLMALGVYPAVPCILTILPNNHRGHYKRATSTALQLAIANCAGFVATFVYTSSQVRTYYRKGHSIVLGFLCFSFLCLSLNLLYCIWENRARRNGKREGNWAKYQQLRDQGKTRAPIGDRAPTFLFTL